MSPTTTNYAGQPPQNTLETTIEHVGASPELTYFSFFRYPRTSFKALPVWALSPHGRCYHQRNTHQNKTKKCGKLRLQTKEQGLKPKGSDTMLIGRAGNFNTTREPDTNKTQTSRYWVWPYQVRVLSGSPI
jgi:hypothetical protein